MKYKALVTIFLVCCLGLLTACSSSPTLGQQAFSYDDIKGSGLANRCPELTSLNMDSIELKAGSAYAIKQLCFEPETFLVEQSPRSKKQTQRIQDKAQDQSQLNSLNRKFVESRLLTRKSFTLDQISGDLRKNDDGSLIFVERGGFDFQPVTVQLPNGERVPLLFTVKGLIASAKETGDLSPKTRLAGEFDVPPYRTSSFIDPKGRGIEVGYDAAVGIPIQADRTDFEKQNQKSFEVKKGQIVLQIDRVEKGSGELSGHFESEQPSDSEFGAKEAMTVKVQGRFYGRVEQMIAQLNSTSQFNQLIQSANVSS